MCLSQIHVHAAGCLDLPYVFMYLNYTQPDDLNVYKSSIGGGYVELLLGRWWMWNIFLNYRLAQVTKDNANMTEVRYMYLGRKWYVVVQSSWFGPVPYVHFKGSVWHKTVPNSRILGGGDFARRSGSAGFV